MSKAAPKTNNGTATTASAVVSGGNRLADIKAALAKAKTSNGGRNNLPCGTGWFLLKNGSFKQTEQKARKLSSFSFLCINQIADGENIAGTSPNYSGPRKWEEYEVALFQDGGFLESTMSKNLQALAACMGWSQEYVKQMQSSDQGITMIMELLKGLLCVSLDGTPTNQPCAFANQVVIELHTKATIKDEKSKSDGQPVFDEHGQKKKVTFINTYWNKKVSLTDVLTTLGEVDTVKAFGTAENFEAAFKAEQDLATLAGA
jgi:hypothetical protein